MAHTTVYICLCLWHLFRASGVETDETESAQVMEGESVTLHTDRTDVRHDDLILWTFGPEDTHIAKVTGAGNEIFPDGADGRFRDRLQLDGQSGSLTVVNTSTAHSGHYKRDVFSGNQVSSKTFSVTVYASLLAPVITGVSPSEGSWSSRCVLLCSVGNVSDVTLSWYKGNRLLSSISISELNTTISLHLEVDYQDNNTYSCELHNPIRHQSTHLSVSDFCRLEEENACINYGHSFPETIVRLVISVLVGVATVAVLIYDIRSRRQ